MKIKKILTVLILCLCSVFCLAGCTTVKGLTPEDISSAISQINRTNEEKLFDSLTSFYNVNFDNIEMVIESYDKSFTGISCISSKKTVSKYTSGKKVKYHQTEYDCDGELENNLYHVADYTESRDGRIVEYNLKTKEYKICDEYEIDIDSVELTTNSLLVAVISDYSQYAKNISMEIIEENKVKYSFVYRMDEEDVLYSYFEVIFNGERIENIKIEEVDLNGFSITNLTVKYDIEEFFVDISECTPV